MDAARRQLDAHVAQGTCAATHIRHHSSVSALAACSPLPKPSLNLNPKPCLPRHCLNPEPYTLHPVILPSPLDPSASTLSGT
jgi:hypothetical protein